MEGSTENLNIAIVGAGPAGCTLARLLLTLPLPSPSCLRPKVTVFEGEVSSTIRSQGGTLDLHSKTGQEALRLAGLHDAFLREARFDGEALTIADKKLKRYLKLGGSKPGQGRGRPEVDRSALRRILFESLPEEIVKWGKRLQRMQLQADGHHVLHFEDGGVATGYDLIVGADGAWSKVRALVSDTMPVYSGISGFSFSVLDVEASQPALHKLVNRGSVFTFSDHHSLALQQMGDGSLNCNAWGVHPEDWLETLPWDLKDGKATKAALQDEYKDWDPRLTAAIHAADETSIVSRKLWQLPIGTDWKTCTGVTLIGDAAHLATPFSGEGVNIAMEDSLELAKAILRLGSDDSDADARRGLAERVATYEEEMFPRALGVQTRASGNMHDMLIQEGAPRTGIESWLIRGAGKDIPPGSWSMMALKAVVYTGYFLFKLVF